MTKILSRKQFAVAFHNGLKNDCEASHESMRKLVKTSIDVIAECVLRLNGHTIHSGDMSIGYCFKCETEKRARNFLKELSDAGVE